LGDISELRIDYKETGKEIIALLCDGNKSAQQADIARARDIARQPFEQEEK
jgi:putative component of toxin-antitoxin plasmid stabilization module